jgi:hypothetical protein
MENEILYPTYEKNWKACDCAPGHFLYLKNQKCYKVETQGPCLKTQKLMLNKNLNLKCVPVVSSRSLDNEQIIMYPEDDTNINHHFYKVTFFLTFILNLEYISKCIIFIEKLWTF